MKAALGLSLLLACSSAKSLPTAPTAVDIVEAQLAAYNARDLEGFLRTYADDATLTSAAKGGAVIMQGKAAMRERYGKAFTSFPQGRARIAERKLEGDGVVRDHEIITGMSPLRPDPWDAGWVRYEVEGGLIKRVELP